MDGTHPPFRVLELGESVTETGFTPTADGQTGAADGPEVGQRRTAPRRLAQVAFVEGRP
ncbi:hypothetical protein STVIR_4977 [Streptomyces viridochromogenes Tue57]|uniref:Uncharacterized protein n=1 Tax=Streptomyces viridochromogenes Tue57 TaxID=1160705 RepID=L8PD18_STRVR|nr:hypothetical protein STVIR_4977 [Streptomyces viridochromogenes Tue57]